MAMSCPSSLLVDHGPASERGLWLPPRLMWRYQWYKAGGGLLVCAIFAGWLLIQWSSPGMRWLSMALIAGTAWIVAISIIEDRRRSRGRQIAARDGTITVTTPQSVTRVSLADVAEIRWQDDTPPGLWLHGHSGEVLAHLDTDFLATQEEARSFLGWLRQQADLNVRVRWPEACV